MIDPRRGRRKACSDLNARSERARNMMSMPHQADLGVRRPRTSLYLVVAMMFTASAMADESANRIIVEKSEHLMYVMAGDSILAKFSIALGANPKGHKHQEGDERTPEGLYVLDYKNSDSSFYKSIHISYPNAEDVKAAEVAGVDPGGQIMIHGQRNGFGWLARITQRSDWTDGCIAITDAEMDRLWKLVRVGTTIEIRP